jgi:hypothetical protein
MLITTLDELKAYLPASLTFNIADLKPYIKRAEERFIIPFLSKAQYDDLHAAYMASIATVPVALSSDDSALLDKVRAPLANFAFFLYVPFAQVQFDSSGVRVSVTENQKPANKDQIEKLIESFSNGGYEGTDQLLDFLEENKATYTLWAASSSYTEFKELFINTTDQFGESVFISPSTGNSRRTFLSLRPVMKKIEDFFIKPVTGKELFDQIKTQIASGTISANNQTLLDMIRPAVANLTIAKAIANNSVVLTEQGISVYNHSEGFDAAGAGPLSLLKNQSAEDGQTYVKQLRDYLYANVSTYPLFEASSAYESGGTDVFTNDPDSTSKIYFI